MSAVRVTYSGLISLALGLSTVITGMLFVVIITRILSPDELGTWSLIGGLITYVIIIEPMISYWTTREIARDVESGKTAVFSSGIFSIIGFLIFLIIAFFVSKPTGTDVDILYFAAIMIPFSFVNRTLSSIALGWKPHVNGYGVIIFDIAKIPLAIFFIYFLDLGLIGVILSITIAYIPSILVLCSLLREKLQRNFNKIFLKSWLKRAWLPSYIKFPSVVVFDVLIFSVITGSVVGLAYWVSAFAIASVVGHSSQITRAVYPKLLSGGSDKFFEVNFIRLLYFAFLFTAISISFAKPALFILNPIYEVAVLVVVFLSLRTFLQMVGISFTNAMQGIEKVDLKEASVKSYLKSKLFYLPTIRLIRRAVYLSTLAISLLILIQFDTSQLDLVIAWSIILFIIEIPFTIYLFYLTKRNLSLSLDIITILKYLLISIGVFTAIHFMMEEFLEYDEKLINFFPNVLPFSVLGLVIYFGLTYLVDHKTRKLFKGIFLEINKMIIKRDKK